ncbi:MAG: orc1/cdc6 family replication initiation protein [Desulfurococcales archaeon]|nr:orc1/cdc6 family replication initiation protein [Desulfurococcales archaeon]
MDILDSILERALKSSVFTDRNVLLPDYVPPVLHHRDEQIKRLGMIVAPALRGERPSNVFIYGLTGTGKTAVTRYVMDRVFQHSQRIGASFKYIYVNTRHRDTPYRVLADIGEGIGLKVPFTGLSTGEVFSRIVKRLNQMRDMVVIVVLDEIDFLVKRHGDDVLYKLVRINEELKSSKLSIVGITNSVYFIDALDARIRSSLGEEEMVFPPYTAGQLRDILNERAKLAFKPGVLDDDVIPYCAALAARDHGDARRALDLLRVAGEIADRNGDTRVTISHVDMAVREIERNRVAEVVRGLPLHAKLVLLAVAASTVGGRRMSTTGEVYDHYKGLVRRIGLSPVTMRRVSDILSELDMLGLITARIVSRGRYGKTRMVLLETDVKALLTASREDPMIDDSGIVELLARELGVTM